MHASGTHAYDIIYISYHIETYTTTTTMLDFSRTKGRPMGRDDCTQCITIIIYDSRRRRQLTIL